MRELDIQRCEELISYSELAVSTSGGVIQVVDVSSSCGHEILTPLHTRLASWRVEDSELIHFTPNDQSTKYRSVPNQAITKYNLL